MEKGRLFTIPGLCLAVVLGWGLTTASGQPGGNLLRPAEFISELKKGSVGEDLLHAGLVGDSYRLGHQALVGEHSRRLLPVHHE